MKLIVTSGPLEGNKYDVEEEITIGRGDSNHVAIPDRSVSVIHCQILFEAEGPVIKDLGSTNGLKINGERLIAAPLRDGDCVAIGKTKMRVEITPSDHLPVATIVSETVPEISGPARETPRDTEIAEHTVQELSGNIFGRVMYYLSRKIANGGMGSIYKAEQFGAEGFIKTVAIKTILPMYVQQDDFVSAFVGEAKLVANLVHQNIVQIHHLGRHDNGYYIAMEYIDGHNLTVFIMEHKDRRREVPIDMATFIVSRICRGLEYAHNKKDEEGKLLGLVHRDVSPNNIMITHEGEVKLTDFGVAKARRFMKDDSEYLVGSVEYMSPEQADCGTVDSRSDLFSLGLVYYELLTGVRVFKCHDNDIDGTLDRVIEAKIPDARAIREDIPDSVNEIMMKCLQREPADRWASAGELGHALESEMYSKGYGPTIVALARYMDEIGLT